MTELEATSIEIPNYPPTIDPDQIAASLHPPFDKPFLVPAISCLVSELVPDFADSDAIISDEISARLPSLLITRLANSARKRLGLEPIMCHHIINSTDATDDQVQAGREIITKHAKRWNKVIVVTEQIDTGLSAMRLISELKRHGISYTLAAVTINKKPDLYDKDIREHLKYGKVGTAGALFDADDDIAGVRKDSASQHPVALISRESRQKAETARKDIKRLHEELMPLIE